MAMALCAVAGGAFNMAFPVEDALEGAANMFFGGGAFIGLVSFFPMRRNFRHHKQHERERKARDHR